MLWQRKISEGGFSHFKCLQIVFKVVIGRLKTRTWNQKQNQLCTNISMFYYSTKFRSRFCKRPFFESKFSAVERAALYSWRFRLRLLDKWTYLAAVRFGPKNWIWNIYKLHTDFLVSLLSISGYRHLSQKAISVLVHMPTTYLCEMSKINQKRETQSRKLISYERGPWKRVTNSFFTTGGWNPATKLNETCFLFHSYCHPAAAFVVAVCTAAIGVGRGPWILKLATFSRKMFFA